MQRTLRASGLLPGLVSGLTAPVRRLRDIFRAARTAQDQALETAILAHLSERELAELGLTRTALESELERHGRT